ncbi:Uu.00g079310.m01.CDS01 [Anthostomella pinea]|uniref:Uu.00g079310.m01.CDS01 n=1 Tax=Anthostomella pinea TaxID=933095 RepID=A0AAI8VLX4_9PEZI|nr:Uu.00g079310.m01.CDS01 [Anthostomella pinea]
MAIKHLLLTEVLQGTPKSNLDALELTAAHTVLHTIRARLGPSGTLALLETDIATANIFWHATVARSSGRFTSRPVLVRAFVNPAILNATSFANWFASAGAGSTFPNALMAGHPAHYLELASDGGITIDIIESWGAGLIAHLSAKPTARQPFMPDLAEFPVQNVVALTLMDGTVFGYTIIAARDLADGSGMEIRSEMWMPDTTPVDIMRGLEEHSTTELVYWLRFAYDGLVDGRGTHEGPPHDAGLSGDVGKLDEGFEADILSEL